MSVPANEGNEKLSHLDPEGRARMVDVGEKDITEREATAEAVLRLAKETLALVLEGEMPKGDVFSTARIAGIGGAKRAAELIPLCHPLSITSVEVEFKPDEERSLIRVLCRARARDRTGVEMEALTGAAVAALTIYDMCKAVERGIEIASLRLLTKSGGKSGTWKREV